MSDEDKMKKYSKLIKSKDGPSNPMARLGRLGAGPDVKLAGIPAPTTTSGHNGAASTSGVASSPAPSSSSAAAKKVFSPNLMPKARKETASSQETTTTPNARERRKREPRTDHGRGRGRGAGRGRGGGFHNSNLVQSSSIFEEGVADFEKRPGASAPSYGGGGGGAGGGDSSLRESISISSKMSQADPERTKEMLKKLFSDDFVSRPDLQSEISPVSLPLYAEEEEKEETEGSTTTTTSGVKRKISLLDVFTPDAPVDDPRMLFLQLPDSLPFDLADLRRDVKRESEAPSTTATNSSEESVTERDPDEVLDDPISKPHTDNPNATTLQKLPEGRIGKVRVRASGKCELVFPNGYVFDLSLGTPSGFHQEFVSVALDEPNKTGEMRSLGTVSHKVIAVPNFETLLKNSIRL